MPRKRYEQRKISKKTVMDFSDDLFSLGELVGSHRTNRGISQENMAVLLGISRRSLSRIENNEVPLTLELLFKMAVVFRVRPSYLLQELMRITKRDWDKSEEEGEDELKHKQHK